MEMFLKAQGDEIWDVIDNRSFIPTTIINNIEQPKGKSPCNDDDKKKVLYDKKINNIFASVLGMNEFFRVSNCKTSKKIWDTLEVTHEGSEDVKRSNLNKNMN